MGCSKQMPTGAGVRKASADGWFQIFYLTEDVALYKHMREEGVRSLPALVKATPFKPTLFQEDYSTGDTIEKNLVENVWKVAVTQTNIVYGIRLEPTANEMGRVYFVVQGGEPRFFPNETEWKTYLAANAVTSIALKLTSEIVGAETVRGVDLPAWSEPVIEGIHDSGHGGARP